MTARTRPVKSRAYRRRSRRRTGSARPVPRRRTRRSGRGRHPTWPVSRSWRGLSGGVQFREFRLVEAPELVWVLAGKLFKCPRSGCGPFFVAGDVVGVVCPELAHVRRGRGHWLTSGAAVRVFAGSESSGGPVVPAAPRSAASEAKKAREEASGGEPHRPNGFCSMPRVAGSWQRTPGRRE